MQIKEVRTAKELETEISNYLGGLDVIVYEDGMRGWTAAVFVPLGEVANTQQFIQIVSEFRARYDLEEGPETTEPPTEAETPPEEIDQAGEAPDPRGRGVGGKGVTMEKSDTADLLVGILREQLKEVDYLVRYLSSLSSGTEIEPDLEEWFNRWVDRLDREDLR